MLKARYEIGFWAHNALGIVLSLLTIRSYWMLSLLILIVLVSGLAIILLARDGSGALSKFETGTGVPGSIMLWISILLFQGIPDDKLADLSFYAIAALTIVGMCLITSWVLAGFKNVTTRS